MDDVRVVRSCVSARLDSSERCTRSSPVIDEALKRAAGTRTLERAFSRRPAKRACADPLKRRPTAMPRFCSIFSQLLQLFPRVEFQKAVVARRAERHARG